MRQITASLVIYQSSMDDLLALFSSLQQSRFISEWVVVDNAASKRPEQAIQLRRHVESIGGHFISAERNLGFGGGHNLALRYLENFQSDFHLIVNPDISFRDHVLEGLSALMYSNPEVGLIMPRVTYPDGEDQYLGKLLPTPLDFALRRFSPGFLQRLASARMKRYELRGLADEESFLIPFLSGCFMFTRRSSLKTVGGFDERFFLYLEDVDLCRRFAEIGKLLYWPHLSVQHAYSRGAHHSRKLMFIFLQSSVRYFDKWGWLIDRKRKLANARAVEQLRQVVERSKDSGRTRPL